jgi:hypothetical protein
MPSTPKVSKLNATSVDILNAIRNNASANYKDYVPAAKATSESVREIGAVIMNFEALQNEFLTALVNRIGLVLITSKSYSNPWAVLKKGQLEYGETIEDIFVNIAKPYEYDPAVAESEVFKREIPDVRATFYTLNYKKFYKATVSQDQLRQAFLSLEGVTNLITKITESLYTSANYDEFITMKYMLAKQIIDGGIECVTVPDPETSPSKVITTIKGVSNNFEFMSNKHNRAGVENYTLKDDQYIIVNSKFDAQMSVEVLAAAFNMDKADFMGHRILVDSFGDLDVKRLNALLGSDVGYEEISQDVLNALDKIPAILVDKDWFMIFDNMQQFTEQYNGQGLYWNYFYHIWKTFGISPFVNAAMFIPATPSVTSVTLTPSAVTLTAGQSTLITATVETENFAPKTVTYTVDSDLAEVDVYGNVRVDASAESGTEIVVTATSTYDETKKGTATITIA